MRNYRLFLRTVVLVVLFVIGLLGIAIAEPTGAPLFEISGSEVRTITSEKLSRSYDLYIKLPPGYRRNENARTQYPVIYLNDGGYCWLTAVGVTRAPFNHGGYEKAILVGLSYAKGENAVASRTRDLTPTKVDGAKRETGGARDYLTFFKEEVIPFIEEEYRADAGRRMLVGHSYGGLFGAYALLEEPGLFQDYVLTSSSLWHDNQILFDLEDAAFNNGARLSGRLYFAIGNTETPEVNGGRNDMVEQQARFAAQLRNRGYKSLIVREEVLEGGTHLTTFPIGFTRALRWMLPGDDVFGG